MDNSTNPDAPATPAHPDVSLVRGGPFYRTQLATRLIKPDQWNVGRRITFAIAVGWIPLLLTTILSHRGVFLKFLADYSMNSRMLIAVPVLLLGQQLMESRFRAILQHIYEAHLLRDADLGRMDEILARLIRWRDSVIPELMILLLLAVHTITSYKSVVADVPWLAYRSGADLHLTLAGWYAVLVSATIFQFLLGFSLWKWLLWTIFAFRLSRLNLRLVPSHPDENGGLGFLALSAQAFAPIAFAATIVIGATFRHDILRKGAHLMDFKLPAVVLLAVIFLVALGPLFFFVPRLAALRRRGILQYAIVGNMQSTAFHEKWVTHGAENEVEVIAAPEISTLCDYNSVYHNVVALKPFPIDQNALIGLAIAVVIPAIPTIVAEIPLAVVLKQLLGALK
jgi:hypothetical protein